ncbi:hypothetical protein SAMD00019534_035560 [Acytostelium subglobosum LB1]|uniref:hypothetical protein n=1 Tax=Acytostelium subglobosum LB1 TaxID=1410327 RepID=UPI0006449D50|nr:hypothetical protein SAMD00019534_035560 [Acytostelium subglobosum LB1]GAM20381.1 hypothetical protein SAMD00019534_035560 [Acytostelium subglobosum LB1]|eukprot:XP_012759902.1 hypothetical protein SAMD00019534_035560 [Acytostelium subglobosum LB1]
MATTTTDGNELPFHDRWHDGERMIQDIMGVREIIEPKSTFFRPFLTVQMQEFVPMLHYMFLGTLDERGRPWASMITGTPGFMSSPHDRSLIINTANNNPRDPLFHNLVHGQRFNGDKSTYWGGVALDLSNRRRNKMNGTIDFSQDNVQLNQQNGTIQLNLTVEQSMGNCPKYITIRRVREGPISGASTGSTAQASSSSSSSSSHLYTELGDQAKLPDAAAAMIKNADTLFIASRNIDDSLAAQTNGMDCNHRGGSPGFVKLLPPDETSDKYVVLIPDYSGNRFFNTLGNLHNDPRAGLMFVDFEHGSTLHLTGRSTVLQGEASLAVYPRIQRTIRMEVDAYLLCDRVLPFTFDTIEASPYSPAVSSKVVGQKTSNMATLKSIVKLSPDVSSFYFQTTSPITYKAGQYAIFDFGQFSPGYKHMDSSNPKSVNDDYVRTWTISSALSSKDSTDNHFEITVKHQPNGAVSSLLHRLELGTHQITVPLMGCEGEFTLESTLDGIDPSSTAKLAMFAGGIGITPFLSMIRSITQSSQVTPLDIHLIVSGRKLVDCLPLILSPLLESSKSLITLNITCFVTSNDGDGDGDAVDNDKITIKRGRITADALRDIVPDIADRHSLLCGPEAFMNGVQSLLLNTFNIKASNIHKEEFKY